MTPRNRSKLPWRPICEVAAVEDGPSLFLWDGNNYHVGNILWTDEEGPAWFNGSYRIYPTHWLLSEPPDDAEKS